MVNSSIMPCQFSRLALWLDWILFSRPPEIQSPSTANFFLRVLFLQTLHACHVVYPVCTWMFMMQHFNIIFYWCFLKLSYLVRILLVNSIMYCLRHHHILIFLISSGWLVESATHVSKVKQCMMHSYNQFADQQDFFPRNPCLWVDTQEVAFPPYLIIIIHTHHIINGTISFLE